MDVSEPASVATGIASRYAKAVFELAKEGGVLPALEADLETLDGTLRDSEDFVSLLNSPVYSREEQGAAVGAVAKALGLGDTMTNTLGVMAAKRRLFVVPALVRELRALISEEKGEVLAEVTAAKALTEDQLAALSAALKASVGKDVKVNTSVDEDLIGGLVIRVGSTMIDTSIASKLSNLQNAMKEVG